MCPLILLLPVFALPLCWVLPLTWSLPLYGVVCALSAWMYYFVMKAMRRPVESGREELLHSVGEVVEASAGSLHVRVHGEIWRAQCNQSLATGDRVRVDRLDGLMLQVTLITHDPYGHAGAFST